MTIFGIDNLFSKAGNNGFTLGKKYLIYIEKLKEIEYDLNG